MECQVRSLASAGKSSTEAGLSLGTQVFPCQYHSTNTTYSSHYFSFPLSVLFHAPYLFIHVPPTLYNVFLPVLQYSPVSIILPMLHTHPITSVFPCQYHSMLHTSSSIYHRHYIMFFFQYLSFPLSVSFHRCSMLIPLLQFSPVSIIPCSIVIHPYTTNTV